MDFRCFGVHVLCNLLGGAYRAAHAAVHIDFELLLLLLFPQSTLETRALPAHNDAVSSCRIQYTTRVPIYACILADVFLYRITWMRIAAIVFGTRANTCARTTS